MLKRIRLRALLKWASIAAAAGFLLIQAFPYGHGHSNPAFHSEPPWDSSRTRELVVDACYDCHSNRTEWPWYSYVAPVSWLVQRDVDGGREELNFSDWPRLQEKLREKAAREREKEAKEAKEGRERKEKLPGLIKVVLEGEMPPWFYPPLHPDARLSATERQELARGLARTFDIPFTTAR